MSRMTAPVSGLTLSVLLLVLAGTSPSASHGNHYAVGTNAGHVNPWSAPGAGASGAGWALPLVGEVPSWFTPTLEQQVLAAPGRPLAAPADAPLPGTVGIRPGSWMIAPHGCTMNFVFVGGGAYGIGTAGHCVDAVGQHVILLTLAPGTSNPVLVDIGTVVVRNQNAVDDDFALVAINPVLSSWVGTTTAVVGGPCGVYSGSGPELVAHYGHGTAIGTGGTPRVGLALVWQADYYSWEGAAFFGDSGSPVRVSDFKAAGVLTALIVDPVRLSAVVAGTRIGRMLEIASGWSLLNSPLCL